MTRTLNLNLPVDGGGAEPLEQAPHLSPNGYACQNTKTEVQALRTRSGEMKEETVFLSVFHFDCVNEEV